MKLFVSWSGTLSQRIAETLREWLPNVVQAIDPWMSAEDIEKGARWSLDVASELEKTKAGILCVTPDNMEAPWLNFEGGALAKTVEKTLVSPYLFGLRPSDLKGPLVQFQATEANKLDTRRLLGTLNKALGEAALPEKQLDKTFERWWPDLETSLEKLHSVKAPHRPQRSDRELLEEILAFVRDQAKRNLSQDLVLAADPGQNEPVIFYSSGTGKSHIASELVRRLAAEKLLTTGVEVKPKPNDSGEAKEKPEGHPYIIEAKSKDKSKKK